MQFSFFSALGSILADSGFASFLEDPRSLIMILISFVLLYMGIGKRFEPLLLIPIAFGMLLANFPLTGLLNAPVDGSSPGMLWVFYQGVQHAIYPSIIFLGIGAMTDFGPLIARPSSLLLGAAAQLGIFSAFLLALALGFRPPQWRSHRHHRRRERPDLYPCRIPSCGGLSSGGRHLQRIPISALIPLQPPIMRLLTTRKEREIKMEQLRRSQDRGRSSRSRSRCHHRAYPDTAPLIGIMLRQSAAPNAV